ncbi:hypothetical protein BK672_10200 [Pseudomonas fluorescens]|uniref:Uncharacterized protein n=1 Tax=Pseudomonas fluorescens TaxID=294 RepID=A0A423NAM3_PSEFL|nr:hypothetical protein BK672_10200 [Pseudomonas fluorescens]
MDDTIPAETYTQTLSDNDTFVKSAQVDDFVNVSGNPSIIIRKRFTEVMVFPVVHYKATITTSSGATYSTSQPIPGSEYINLLSRGDEITIGSAIYRVSHGEFMKQSNGEWLRKVYSQPVIKTQ